MSKVVITRSKLDSLATTISAKSGEPLPLTIAQMDAAVQGIETGGSTPTLQSKTATPTTSQQTVTPDTGYDGLSQVTVNSIPSQYIVPTGTKSITENGTGIDVASYASVDVAVPSPTPSLQSKIASYTPSETAQSATVTADSGYDGLSSVDVSVGGIPSDYVGSGIRRRSSTDLVVNGDTVSAPSGYYQAKASSASVASGTTGSPALTKTYVAHDAEVLVSASVTNTTGYIEGGTLTETTRVGLGDLGVQGSTTIDSAGSHDVTFYETAVVQSGTEGTPTATKGTVSNHSVSVTPSVTNTTGYIEGGTKNGTAVSVSASELVSGTYTVNASGTHDVTNYASASVTAGGATASATKGAVSNHSVTVTPSVTRTAGYVTAGTANGTAVTVSASELVSGTKAITGAGTTDVTEYESVSVASGGATASATKGAVSNHSVTVTPSVTRTAGYVTAGSSNGTAVTVSASELVSGSQTITDNGTVNVTNLASVTVDIDFVTYHTSSSEPTSSQGSDGDIWLVTE